MRMSEAWVVKNLVINTNPQHLKNQSSPKSRARASEGERILELQLQFAGIPFEREFKFHATRKWRADFLITGTKILVEVEGGVYSGGRHTRGSGYEADAEKYNAAAIEGWTVLRYTTGQVQKGLALQGIQKILGV